jgi:VanZ like family
MRARDDRAVAALRAIGTTLTRLPRVTGLILALVWIGVIWRISSIKGVDGPQSFLRSWLHNSAHAPFFGFLVFLLAIALPRENGWPRIDRFGAILIVSLAFLYALVDEWHQGRVPGRDPDWSDVVTDLIGACVTLWMIAWLGKSDARRGGLWPRIAAGLALCLAGGFVAALRSWR